MLTSGTGGVLVQALLVPQQDNVKALSSAQARARLVASVSGNGVVTASVGSSALLVNATSPAIGSYVVVGASSSTAQALTVSVNGTPLAVPAQTLAPGGDYTLMVWGNAAAPQWTLLTDDNRLPAVATNARLRLVHGVVGLADALTLTTDFSPVAANVAQGQASAYATVVASATMRLQVTSPRSTTPLYDQTSTPISGNQLYTVFVLGDSSAPYTALRKER